MNFDYTFRWNVAFKALPDMLAGSWITIETAVLSMVFGVRYIVLPMAARVSFCGLGQCDAGGTQRHLAGFVDRHHRAAARLAVHRDPHPGADTGAVHCRCDVLRDELGHGRAGPPG